MACVFVVGDVRLTEDFLILTILLSFTLTFTTGTGTSVDAGVLIFELLKFFVFGNLAPMGHLFGLLSSSGWRT